MATEATVRSHAYRDAIQNLRPDLDVVHQASPLLVPLVEEGWLDDPITEAIARRYLEPLVAAQVDTIVLGCTHYPALERLLRRVCPPTSAKIAWINCWRSLWTCARSAASSSREK